jgi:N-acetylmuramoyl-L-alanine amidase
MDLRWWLFISRKVILSFSISVALVALIAISINVETEPDQSVLSYGIAGRIIVIDPGHGGIDSGAIGRVLKTPEKDVTLAISKKLARTLSQAGAMVVLTRDSDQDLSDEGFQGPLIERKRQDLGRRVQKAQQLKADMYLSIHTNADPSPKWHGAQTFYYGSSPRSKELAISIQDELVRILGNNKRKAKEGSFYVMKNSNMPAVMIEVGFISNPVEERLLIDDLYQTKVTHAIFSGIVKCTSKEDWWQ